MVDILLRDKQDRAPEETARWFHALGDETRRQIMAIFAQPPEKVYFRNQPARMGNWEVQRRLDDGVHFDGGKGLRNS